MDTFFAAIVLLALIGGFVGGTILSRSYWILVYRRYTNEVKAQYVHLLKKFGLKQNSNGVWEMHNEDGTWIKQVK